MVTVNGGLDVFFVCQSRLRPSSPFKEFEIGLRKRGGGKHRN